MPELCNITSKLQNEHINARQENRERTLFAEEQQKMRLLRSAEVQQH